MPKLSNYRNIIGLMNPSLLTEEFDSASAKIVTVPDFSDDPSKKLTLSFISWGQGNVTKSMRNASFVCLKNVPRVSAVKDPNNLNDEPTNFKDNCESHMVDGDTLYFIRDVIPSTIAQVFVGSLQTAASGDSWGETEFAGKTNFGEAKISFLVNVNCDISDQLKTWFIKATCMTKSDKTITRITALVVKDDPIENVELQSILTDV